MAASQSARPAHLKTDAVPVKIILATLNGSDFIDAQISSLLDQTYTAWSLCTSDDGSMDDTLARIRSFKDTRIDAPIDGPKQGVAQNFLTALATVPQGQAAAFCDQDDVWMPDKLERAMSRLEGIDTPALYSAGRSLATRDMRVYGVQTRTRSSQFAHLLFRNCVFGNTCVLNAAAVRAVQQALPVSPVAFHDWYAAQVITGVGGRLLFDPHPVVHYRQHNSNLIGASRNRLALLANGSYARWVQSHLQALQHVSGQLTPSARAQLDSISRLAAEPMFKRLRGFYREVGHLASLGLAVCATARRPFAER